KTGCFRQSGRNSLFRNFRKRATSAGRSPTNTELDLPIRISLKFFLPGAKMRRNGEQNSLRRVPGRGLFRRPHKWLKGACGHPENSQDGPEEKAQPLGGISGGTSQTAIRPACSAGGSHRTQPFFRKCSRYRGFT